MGGGAMKKRVKRKDGTKLKEIPEKNKGLAKLDVKVRNKMGYAKTGGRINKMGGGMMKKRMKRGGKVGK